MLPAEEYCQPHPEPVLAGNVNTQDPGSPAAAQNHEAETNCNNNQVEYDIGKEVVDPGHDGLQVDKSGFLLNHGTGDPCIGKVADASPNEKVAVNSPNPGGELGQRKKWICSIIIFTLVVITAAVLGAVLGSRKSDDSNAGSSGGTEIEPSPTGSTGPDITTPKFIKQGSRLSATAWRKGQGFQIFLYYQSENGTIRWSTYDDTQSSFTYNGSYWGNSAALSMESSADAPASYASFTATILLWDTAFEPQIEFFYFNLSKGLRGVDSTNDAAQYQRDSINEMDLVAETSSSLASYWPYCAYVNESDEVAVVGNVPYSETTLSPTSDWTVASLAKSAMPGSRLAIVPLVSNMVDLLGAGGYGVFYQDTNGNLVYTQPNRAAADANGTLVDSWPTDAEYPSISLPAGGSFAAFTTARSDSSEGRVNTYVLYQEISSRISMLYLNNDSNWMISQPEAMSIADNGTAIACLTMPMSQNGGGGNELDLEEASSHANRCYFQRGGHLREFALSGTDWIELGTIPID